MICRLIPAVLFASSLALAGCGKVGELEQPAPLFGAKAKADYEAKKRAEADAKAKEKKDNSQPTSPNVQDPNHPPLTQAPYTTPMPGAGNNPFGTVPQGSLPNPGNGPQ